MGYVSEVKREIPQKVELGRIGVLFSPLSLGKVFAERLKPFSVYGRKKGHLSSLTS
jgi:hypothetical protein